MSGPFGSSQWMYASGGFYPYEIDQSVRFNAADSAYLEKTFSTTGDEQIFTISFWFKRCRTGTAEYLFSGGNDVSNRFHMDINASGTFQIEGKSGGSTQVKMEGGPVLRDVGAWYNFVLRVDTTQSTASDRVRLYVNGDLLTFNSNTYPSQNANLNWNINDQVRIGLAGWNTSTHFDGYFAEFINVDGSSLAPTSFGETKAGIWIPKDYTGSYGTNGFKLAFQDSASLGDDTSGNGHDFTSSGLASTDQMPDSPTSNFPTMNKLWQSKGTWTTAEGNLQNTWAANDYQSGVATMGLPATGKWYWEIYLKSRTYTNWLYWNLVIADYVEGSGSNGNSAAQWSNHYFSMSAERSDTGYLVVSSGSTNSIASSGIYDTGNVIQVAFDADNKRLYLGDSGTWFLSADPGAESGDGTAVWYNWSDDAQGKLFPALNVNYFTYVDVHNFGQDSTFAGNLAAGGNADANGIGDFKYTVPSGYLALCAANLPAPGIDPAADEAPTDYFNTVLYTGDGSTSNAITGVGFSPDFVWIKKRGPTAASNRLLDTVRGVQKNIYSDAGTAEETQNSIMSFDSDGFTLGDSNGTNQSTHTFVSWNWKAGGAAVSNTDGTITSSVSASPESGFSVVTYSGNGTAGATIGHGLGKAPDMIILKRRNETRNWQVYHSGNTSAPETDKLTLNLTDATVDDNTSWNDTAPSASVFTVGTSNGTNNSSGTYVAYCFANIDGMVKAGSYFGNSSTTFVYTGFRPAFVMIKSNNQTRNWIVFDNKRTPTNQMDGHLHPNANVAEQTGSDEIDFLSNGFNLRSPDNDTNTSAFEYIYLAFAEQPFKYANAR